MAAKKSVELSGVVVARTSICSIDAERGILRYRGYDIGDLAEHATYEETAYLLLEGDLPTTEQLSAFRDELSAREIPQEVCAIVDGSASTATAMESLRTAVSALSFSDPAEGAIDAANERRKAARLIAQLPTIVARYLRAREGRSAAEPDPSLAYAESFLAMILHAEHELNASTFAARVVAGTLADLHSAVVAAICALKGPIHGGANTAAMRIMDAFGSADRVADGVHELLARKQTLFGFGHPLYRTMDPRVPILRDTARRLAEASGETRWYDVAVAYEREAHEQKGLWPNVDLYSGVVYRYLGLPDDSFPALFEMSRVAGQAAHVLEQHTDNKIIRPSGEYVGPAPRRLRVREPR